jgi:hypothetical protein
MHVPQALFLILIWIGGITVVSRRYGYAFALGYVELTANQFFSAWGGFFTSVYLLARWFAASMTTSDWILLCATSGAVFGASSALENNHVPSNAEDVEYQCNVSSKYSCERIAGARIWGAVSLVTAFVMGILSLIPNRRFPFITNILIGTVLVIGWCIGLGKIHFSVVFL